MKKPTPGIKKEKRERTTLNKLIASRPTRAEKWECALLGGKPQTPIQNLAFWSTGLEPASPEEHVRQWKGTFADLLFPALMKNDPAPFGELLEAMAILRRETTFSKGGLRIFGNRPKPPAKKEAGRKLRLGILDLQPDDLTSIQAVLKFLESRQVEFSDESHVRRVMREMKIHLLKPGDMVYLRFSPVDPTTGRPTKWVCPRKFVVHADRTITNFGMSRKRYDDLLGCKAHQVVSGASAKPDK